MTEKVKLFISGENKSQYNKIKEIISAYPEIELCSQPTTKAGQILNTNLLMKRISDIFITVGIPAHIQGYKYLREAIKLTIEQPGIINSITKKLYPTIANQFETSPSKVERAIRHAIEVGWSRGKIENINNIFGVKVYGHNDRPTNGEFIALIADKMLVDSVS
jgi:two-component system response regulator (stage 0 sporulation protein A)